MKLFRKLGPNQSVTARHYNDLVDFVNSLRPHPEAGLKSDRLGWRKISSGGGGRNRIRRAKLQEGPTTDGLLSVKFVDKDGTEQGDAFDVWTNYEKSESFDMDDHLPAFVSGDVWPIKQISGEWYLDWTYDEVTEITVQTNYQVDGASSKLQKKTRTAKVPDPGTESGWTDVHTGTECT